MPDERPFPSRRKADWPDAGRSQRTRRRRGQGRASDADPSGRDPRPTDPPVPAADRAADSGHPVPQPPASRPVKAKSSGRAESNRRQRTGREDHFERGLRGLVGAGPSQVSVSAALRARDAARPTDEDLAAAETELTIVRRHYVPPS